jgi:hypothetical protein
MSLKNVSKTGNGDEYYTPKYVVEILISYLKEKGIKKIWCPCDKDWSAFVSVLRSNNFEVIYSHIDDGKDFLTYEPLEDYDAIITNPPFSIKNKVLQRCLDLKKPFAMLLSATCIQSASLINIISKCENFNFIMFDKRISYSGDRPPFPSWYFTNNLLDGNKFYIYQEDPKKMLSK